MSSPLPYPRLVVADVHAHERNNRARMREVGVLIQKLTALQQQYQAQTLIINGDLFDRNTPLTVDSIVMLAHFFRTFTHTVIIVGNHDTPVRAASHTMLDIFSLVGAKVIASTEIIGNDLFVPYYDQIIPHPAGGTYDQIHMHKDVRELNFYVDQEFGVAMSQIPPCVACFNGHLHTAQVYALPAGGVYIQCGSPYPTSWNDSAEKNNSAWVVTGPDKYGTAPMMITGDDGCPNAEEYAFLRKRGEKGEVTDENPLEGISVLRDSSLPLESVLAMTNYEKQVNNIIRSAVRYATRKIESVRI